LAYLLFSSHTPGEPEQICLREWEPSLRLDYEFRCFVYRDIFTAISQYDHYTYYPYLFPQKDFLKQGLFSFWKKIHPFIVGSNDDTSYVIDIGYLVEKKEFILIELSPFTPCTGPALFHWQYDKDILQGKYLLPSSPSSEEATVTTTAPDYSGCVVFRLKEEKDIHPNVEDLVELNWNMRWREEKLPFDAFYETTVEDINETQSEQNQGREGGFTVFARLSLAVSSVFHSNPTKDNRQSKLNESSLSLPTSADSSSVNYLFVYGTLKRGFYWNSKYLHPRFGAKFISEAMTVNKQALVIGDCGVPYLLHCKDEVGDRVVVYINNVVVKTESPKKEASNDESTLTACGLLNDEKNIADHGFQIKGELWEVDDYCLKGLDDYEGIEKGFYQRVLIPIVIMKQEGQPAAGEELIMANVYVLVDSSSVTALQRKEFLSEYSLKLHEKLYKPIQHIQVKQCNYYKQPSNWGKTTELIEGTSNIPNH
jgi:gamma-glutamylcyclotransferase (GGCT)/AIG2-like uncharacterized protein YtfP